MLLFLSTTGVRTQGFCCLVDKVTRYGGFYNFITQIADVEVVKLTIYELRFTNYEFALSLRVDIKRPFRS